jgi:hypothetical protein
MSAEPPIAARPERNAAPIQIKHYFVGLRGRLSDLLLAQPLTCGNLSGSILSQSKHFETNGGRAFDPESKSIGFPHVGQSSRSRVDTSSIPQKATESATALPVYFRC